MTRCLLTDKHICRLALFYLGCFLWYMGWCAYYGLTFTQLQPVFFLNKTDLTGNLLMLSGLQHKLTADQATRSLFDLVYISLPVFLTLGVYRKWKATALLAALTSIFSIVYNYFFSIMSFVSIEVTIGWMLIPLLFINTRPSHFYYLLHSIRLLFIIFFLSAAFWKVRAGGIFNTEQMSAILSRQHIQYLSGARDSFGRLLDFLIDHPALSYWLYFSAFFAELFFAIGLFTRRRDRVLIVLFCLFALINFILMEINYFTWLPLAATLYYSRFSPPAEPLKNGD